MKLPILTTFASVIALATATVATANPVPPADVPIPALRYVPEQQATAPTPPPVAQKPNVATEQITGAVIRASAVSPISGSLKSGLDALDNKDQQRARAIRNGMSKNSLDRKILTWAIAQSGLKGLPSSEIARASSELKSWPGTSNLRYRWERAIYHENPSANSVIAAFGNLKPKTAEGAIVLTRALLNAGRKKNARAIILPFWHNERMDENDENIMLKEFSSLLSKADHKRRMDMLLYRDRVTQAKRMSKLAGAESLYNARAATIRKKSNADKLINSVHRSWHKDPSYLFTKIERARREQRWSEAVKLISKTPKNKDVLVNSGEWWVEQRIISRNMFENGKASAAYKIAANHSATRARDVVEAEFHAGFYALRGLNKPQVAAKHFANIFKASTTPLSASRAYYWLGRAAQAGGPGKSRDYYAKAASYPSTYYGQLAGARINNKKINVKYPKPSGSDRSNFANREAVRAIKKLEANGHAWRADRMYRSLARVLTDPGELAILASMAEKRGNYQLALQVGKLAYARGLDVAALAFPLGAIPKSAIIKGTGKALAYSIARQESTFNKAAISPADARGLLQLLPSTAKRVAKTYGVKYSKSRLTTDAGMNAKLGALFLNEQITNFDGSYIMTFIGYNAGPRRIPQWMARFGDPRGKDIDHVVDWVEMIPFTETRNYVQRVMENYQVYKTRLGQRADIVNDLRFGRR
ncbi:MAG: lytic transglycosylase domain-containing protein [Lentilitoribacter sp.]